MEDLHHSLSKEMLLVKEIQREHQVQHRRDLLWKRTVGASWVTAEIIAPHLLQEQVSSGPLVDVRWTMALPEVQQVPQKDQHEEEREVRIQGQE